MEQNTLETDIRIRDCKQIELTRQLASIAITATARK